MNDDIALDEWFLERLYHVASINVIYCKNSDVCKYYSKKWSTPVMEH